MGYFATLDRLLAHVMEVESEMIDLSGRAHRKISQWIGETGAQPSDEVLEALQYQDILSQQLSATVEAIATLRSQMERMADLPLREEPELEEKVAVADVKLQEALETALSKHSAYRGRADAETDDGIEFF